MDNDVKKNTITEEVVRYVAELSRLSLEDKDVDAFRQQLAGILDYVEQLQEVDTDEVLPTSHVLSSMKNVFREDDPVESISPEGATQNAPAKKDNFFKVPGVIKDA